MGNSHGVMAKVLDSIRLQSQYYIFFWTNNFRKGMNPLYFSYRLNNIIAVILQGWLWH